MESEHCANIMKYLIAKYIEDRDLVFKLYNEIDQRKERPPGKGIMYEFLEKKSRTLYKGDDTLVDDLAYYYG